MCLCTIHSYGSPWRSITIYLWWSCGITLNRFRHGMAVCDGVMKLSLSQDRWIRRRRKSTSGLRRWWRNFLRLKENGRNLICIWWEWKSQCINPLHVQSNHTSRLRVHLSFYWIKFSVCRVPVCLFARIYSCFEWKLLFYHLLQVFPCATPPLTPHIVVEPLYKCVHFIHIFP